MSHLNLNPFAEWSDSTPSHPPPSVYGALPTIQTPLDPVTHELVLQFSQQNALEHILLGPRDNILLRMKKELPVKLTFTNKNLEDIAVFDFNSKTVWVKDFTDSPIPIKNWPLRLCESGSTNEWFRDTKELVLHGKKCAWEGLEGNVQQMSTVIFGHSSCDLIKSL